MKYFLRLFFIILIFINLISCNRDKFKVDVSKINVNIKIKRFDEDIFSFNPDSVFKYIPFLENKYGEFFHQFCRNVIKIGDIGNRNFPEYLRIFITDVGIEKVHIRCHEKYKNIDLIEQDIDKAFRYYLYYFPGKTVPQVYTYISGYNQSVFTTENILAIGLDKYLGNNFEDYIRLQIPRFAQLKMNENMIIPDCMRALAYSEFENKDSLGTLLGNMIYEGKIQYFLDAVLPDTPDSTKIAYSARQVQWCEKYKRNMWLFLISHKLLYSTDYIEIKQYINDGPFTNQFSKQSPPRTGVWIGWQIVRSYMDNNPQVTLSELMNNNDYQSIMNRSKYKP